MVMFIYLTTLCIEGERSVNLFTFLFNVNSIILLVIRGKTSKGKRETSIQSKK